MVIVQKIFILLKFYLIYINHKLFISCAFVCRKQYAFPYIINKEELKIIEKDVNKYTIPKNRMLLINDDCDILICYEITKETNLQRIKEIKKENKTIIDAAYIRVRVYDGKNKKNILY